MFNSLKDLFGILTPAKRRQLVGIQLLLVVMSFAELAVVMLIPLFFVILGEGKVPVKLVETIFTQMGMLHENNFDLTKIAFFFFLLILASNIFLIMGNYLILKFSASLGVEFSSSLFKYYLNQDYMFHLKHNKTEFITDIINEVQRVQGGIIFPLLTLMSKSIVIALIVGNLFVTNTIFTIKIVIFVTLIYFIFYKTIRKMLIKNGRIISLSSSQRLRYLSESFSSIKEVKVYQKESFFERRHQSELATLLFSNAQNAVIEVVPKYFFETLAFGGVCFFVIGFANKGMSIESTLPTLSLYALSGYKLMPSAQQVFNCFTNIRSNVDVLNKLASKIKEGLTINFEKVPSDKKNLLEPKKTIELKNISFSYNGTDEQIKDLSLSIPVGKKVAFVGLSGSGKTTTANILLGLLKPSKGELSIDGKKVEFDELSSWLKHLSFVPQFIYLMDSSIASNLAFGEEDFHHNTKFLEEITHKANIKNFIENLPEKFDTVVGDDGVKLSGGQKQRLGLARALYFDRPVIVMDEATSSLDNINESEVMKNIQSIENKTILIIAHRLSTIKDCDCIYLFDEGKVVATGSYDELKEKSSFFNRLIQGQSNL